MVSVLGGFAAEPLASMPREPLASMSPRPRPNVITFTGDILLDRGVRQRIEAAGGDVLFTPAIDSILAASDIVVGNLECPATSIHAPAYKHFVFRAEPAWLDILRRHHFTHLNLANNHSVDQGRRGLEDTHRQVLAHGMTPIGAAPTAEVAAQPVLLVPPSPEQAAEPVLLFPPSPSSRTSSVSVPGGFPAGKPVFLLPTLRLPLEHFFPLPSMWSVSQDADTTLLRRVRDLRRAHPKAIIIVTPHWGWEHHTRPEPEQRQLARALIDAGADCIIGHHPHTLQTHETYRGRHIFYSIGNFIFDQTRPVNTRAAIVTLTITADTLSVRSTPIRIHRCAPYVAKM